MYYKMIQAPSFEIIFLKVHFLQSLIRTRKGQLIKV
ncbi:hypothetical protein Amico_0121 [Aminobacterium colombiense DSM 12261]|uniref:Uncharacterized protein n=1 Tax=Aminobacterium colombiense (strain DSM 12261 / ALA-1) TaxID=572547 RepID=D5ECI7_AMICL|nr:hypothetical protein Amico_0121 [Aminobacterium colombiense DSM 12261]